MIPLTRHPGPGFFITATATDVGKTTVTAILAAAFHGMGWRVGLCKPVVSGCPKYADRGNDHAIPITDDDLIPIDSLLPGRCAGLDIGDVALLRNLSPVRYAAPISPHFAARIEGRPMDWARVAAALAYWKNHADVMLVEGAGGWLTPLDAEDHTIANVAAALALPVILVAAPQLGTLNSTMLTVESIRARKLPIAGVIINRVPAENQRDLSMQLNLAEIPRLTGVPLLGVLPEIAAAGPLGYPLPEELLAPLRRFAESCVATKAKTSAPGS